MKLYRSYLYKLAKNYIFKPYAKSSIQYELILCIIKLIFELIKPVK